MSRPSSRARKQAPTPVMASINDVVRRSRALTSSITSSYSSRPASREGSRGRRNSILNEYSRRSVSLDRASRFDDMIAQAGGVPRATKIRRWDGNCRTTTNWDCLRKDPELWFSNGDCLVHFYGENEPRRGPSLRLWLADIQSSNCRPLLQRYPCRPYQDSSSESDGPDINRRSGPLPSYDLYIPAPKGLRYDDATEYHLTTRNFFAWMFEKPLVGVRLGQALCGLIERMNEWRYDAEENEDDFLAYIDSQGYTDFRDCPDHALAVLHWAELYQHADLWTDSFVHCTGMNDQLVSSQELNNISITTKAMITRANLDMAVRLDRASAALADFFENDDVLNRRLHLSDASLRHLERFRTWLQGFYVQRHGYWPPHIMKSKHGRIVPLPKHTLLTMYSDFRNLYQFLVNSDADPFSQPEVSRSVVDVLTIYDEEMKYVPLPHLIPHLPSTDFDHGELRRAKSSFSVFKSKKSKFNGRRAAVASALTVASNTSDLKVVGSGIVREYALFERNYTMEESERITATEARMARWVLIYALLQTLISVTHAPDEVRDVEGVDYPLCVQISNALPWTIQKETPRTLKRRSQSMHSIRKVMVPEPETVEFERPQSVTASYSRPRTAPNGFSAGPPPSQPLPVPSKASRAPSRAEQANARTEVPVPKPSRIPVPIAPPTPKSTPKRSRIPVPVFRSPSRQTVEPLDMDEEVSSDNPEDGTDQDVTPIIPQRSHRRNISSVTSIPTYNQTELLAPKVVEPESTTPVLPTIKSALRKKRYSTEDDISSDEENVAESSEPPLRKDSLPLQLESPPSSPNNFYDASPMAAQNYSMPLSSTTQSASAEPKIQTPVLQAAPRGRRITRTQIEQPRQESSVSSTSGRSSETEHHTLASRITTPSIYASSTFGDRFVHRSRHSNPSSPKDQSFIAPDIPPLPPTPSTPHSFSVNTTGTTGTSIYSLAPEYPPANATGALTEVRTEEFNRIEAMMERSGRTTKAAREYLAMPERPATSHSTRDFPPRSSSHRPSITGSDEVPLPSPSTGQFSGYSADLHEAGKSRRQRLFANAEDLRAKSSIAARRQKQGLVAMVSRSIVSKPLSSPALQTPATPMSFASFESAPTSPRTPSRPGTSLGSRRPSHQRQRSSELAQQFRQEIRWKTGPGWDMSAENLLLGENPGVVA